MGCLKGISQAQCETAGWHHFFLVLNPTIKFGFKYNPDPSLLLNFNIGSTSYVKLGLGMKLLVWWKHHGGSGKPPNSFTGVCKSTSFENQICFVCGFFLFLGGSMAIVPISLIGNCICPNINDHQHFIGMWEMSFF